MDTFKDMENDVESLLMLENPNRTELQLAAELGKTLIEKNKELEAMNAHLQSANDDQKQVIEYLQKQCATLRDTDEERTRVYEQLESTALELEQDNNRLEVEVTVMRRRIASLQTHMEAQEARNEELTKRTEHLQSDLDTIRKREHESVDSHSDQRDSVASARRGSEAIECASPDSSENKQVKETETAVLTAQKLEEQENNLSADSCLEQMYQLLEQLRESKAQNVCLNDKLFELEEQMETLLKENQSMERRLYKLRDKQRDSRSMQEEITTLEEVRQGQLCSKCLRTVNDNGISSKLCPNVKEEIPEDDDESMLEALLAIDGVNEMDTSPTHYGHKALWESHISFITIQGA